MVVNPTSKTSHSPPPSPPREEKKNSSATSQVAQRALHPLKKKILGGAGSLVIGLLKVDTTLDKKYLDAIFGNGASNNLLSKIEKTAPDVYAFIQRLAPTSKFLEANPKDVTQFLNDMTIHCIANLAISILTEDEKITVLSGKKLEGEYTLELFIQKLVPILGKAMGEGLNQADKQIFEGNLKKEVFKGLSVDLFNRIFPPTDPFLTKLYRFKKKEDITDQISEVLFDNAKPFIEWLKGNELVLPQSKLGSLTQPVVEIGQFAICSLADTSYRDSLDFLKRS